ncbi:hypothetical protein KHQ82_00450 [Mycoplasmatota bacterium]|nr:hypothetical protein KHQ82_00450 [Mycoplasmatota bacterium]
MFYIEVLVSDNYRKYVEVLNEHYFSWGLSTTKISLFPTEEDTTEVASKIRQIEKETMKEL